jgi:hypothetical protein
MWLRSSLFLPLFLLFSLSCQEAQESSEEAESLEGSTGAEGGRAEPDERPAEEALDEPASDGFDPCPEDTYILLEENGVRYEITIQVFCEPIMLDINLGCPEPFVEDEHN